MCLSINYFFCFLSIRSCVYVYLPANFLFICQPMYVFQPVSVPVCLLDQLSDYIYVCPSINFLIGLTNLSEGLFIYMSVSTGMSVCMSVCMPVCLYVYIDVILLFSFQSSLQGLYLDHRSEWRSMKTARKSCTHTTAAKSRCKYHQPILSQDLNLAPVCPLCQIVST